jgi:uncharacterized protein YydD (DUF2326 family)
LYLKSLTISDKESVIRDIRFRDGLNLIVDETPGEDVKETGNNVGKTTVLMLIDFCLGGDSKVIYTDPESKRDEYTLVKDFLMDSKVLLTLVLKADLAVADSEEVRIERNFLSRRQGCSFSESKFKQELIEKIRLESLFKARLEKTQTKSAYETTLSILNREIGELNKRKSAFGLNETFEADLEKLNRVKYEITLLSEEVSRLNLRRDLILEAERDMASSKSSIDARQLEQIYRQATTQVGGIQKTFEDLLVFHNRMLEEKIRFITRALA